MKNKRLKVIGGIFSVFIVLLLVYILVYVLLYIEHRNNSVKVEDDEHNVYASGSDKTIIIQYGPDNEEKTITLRGEERNEILEILRHLSDNLEYDDKNFNYGYMFNFGNGNVGYLDVNEKKFREQEHVYFDISEEECNKIESLFQ